MKKFLTILGVVLLIAIVAIIVWNVRPLYDKWSGKPPAHITVDTLEIHTLFEDTLKINTLSRKIAKLIGFETLYNDLLAKYQVKKSDTVYLDTTEQKLSLNLSFIIRIDKKGKNLNVYTYKITGIEGLEGNIVEKIKTAVNEAIMGKITAIGNTAKYPFSIPKDADYQVFVTQNMPKLIVTRQLPIHLSLFLRPKYQILPDKQFFVNVGAWLKSGRWYLTGFYETPDKASVELTYELPVF